MYELIISNIGCVERTEDSFTAWRAFKIYKESSLNKSGRAGGEEVTLLEDGEPIGWFKPKSTR